MLRQNFIRLMLVGTVACVVVGLCFVQVDPGTLSRYWQRYASSLPAFRVFTANLTLAAGSPLLRLCTWANQSSVSQCANTTNTTNTNTTTTTTTNINTNTNTTKSSHDVTRLHTPKVTATANKTNFTLQLSNKTNLTRQLSNRTKLIKLTSNFTVKPAENSTSAKTTTKTTTTTTTTKAPPAANDSQKLLCVHFAGRLGNQLFEYASTLGLALMLNRIPVFLGNSLLKPVLKNFSVSTANIETSVLEERCKKSKSVGESSCCKFSQQLTTLDPKFDYHIGTYLQSYKYFEKHEARIRKAVLFNDDIRQKASAILEGIRRQYNHSVTLVGVHIRRGDMASEHLHKMGYPVAPPNYVNRSVAFFKELYADSVFIVGSDTIQWCKQNFPPGFPVHFLEKNSPALDMQILSSADHTIISFGTYSWWVAFFNPGKTVYMKDFIVANTFIGKAFLPKGDTYIYPGWIPLR